ncbi:MAG: AEC family transporter [Granulosicoccus sp.]
MHQGYAVQVANQYTYRLLPAFIIHLPVTDLALQIINILAPSMLLAGIGLVWFHKGPDFPVAFVSTLVLNVSVPALLFHTMANSLVPLATLGAIAAGTVLVHAVSITVAFTLLKLTGKDIRLCIAMVVGNTGNLGLPVCYFAFGDQGLAYAMAFFAVQCLLLFSFGDAVHAGVISFGRVLRSPVLHAIWLGLLVGTLNVPVPAAIMASAQLLGQIVIPIMLITLGVSLAGMRAAQLPSVLAWSLIRTALALCVGFGVAEFLGLQGVARAVLIIQSVVPVAVFNYLLTLKHGHDAAEVSGLILVTHIGAILYLPVLLSFLL